MNLYDQLTKLQTIPEAFLLWEQYRRQVTDYILDYAEGTHEVAIFGAGACNDIDLLRLVNHFDKVYLLDQNIEALNNALKQYGLEKSNKVYLTQINFIGLEDADYRAYADALVQQVRIKGLNTDINVLCHKVIEQLTVLEAQIRRMKFEYGSYDNCVAIGIHSQLLSMLSWIWQVILDTIGRQDYRVQDKIRCMNDEFIKLFNNGLLQASRYKCIIGCEWKRINQEGFIEGAVQGLVDLKRRKEEKEICIKEEKKIIWPFNERENKCYDMLLQCIDNLNSKYVRN